MTLRHIAFQIKWFMRHRVELVLESIVLLFVKVGKLNLQKFKSRAVGMTQSIKHFFSQRQKGGVQWL